MGRGIKVKNMLREDHQAIKEALLAWGKRYVGLETKDAVHKPIGICHSIMLGDNLNGIWLICEKGKKYIKHTVKL